MDRDREGTNAPPELRLPPALPVPPAKLAFSRREIILCAAAAVLLAALGVWFAAFAAGAARTPRQVVDRFAGEELQVQEEIVHISLLGEPGRSVYFYTSGGSVACALLRRGAAGYRVQDAAGSLPAEAAGKQGVWKMLGNDRGETFVFGLLYNPALKSVEVDGDPAVVVAAGPYRCWYYYAKGNASINSESVVYMA